MSETARAAALSAPSLHTGTKEVSVRIVTRISTETFDGYAVIDTYVEELLADLKWAQELKETNKRFGYMVVLDTATAFEGLPDPEDFDINDVEGCLTLEECFRVVSEKNVSWYMRAKHASDELQANIWLTEEDLKDLLKNPKDVEYCKYMWDHLEMDVEPS